MGRKKTKTRHWRAERPVKHAETQLKSDQSWNKGLASFHETELYLFQI